MSEDYYREQFKLLSKRLHEDGFHEAAWDIDRARQDNFPDEEEEQKR